MMSSGKKGVPIGNKIQRNTVYGISFKDQRPQLISSTEFERSVVDSDVMAMDAHPSNSRAVGRDQNRRGNEDSEGIPVSRSGHPKKGGVVNNFLMDGWQTR